jgi:hypothetical protein
MKDKAILVWLLFLYASPSVLAQNQYRIPACSSSATSGKVVGGRIKLRLPKGAIVKTGRDADYSDYAVGFRTKKGRFWLEGIYGWSATSGKVPTDWLSASVEVTYRTWKAADLEGVDVKGKLANGNYWRYLGHFGESIKYYDVPGDAAAYFDSLLNKACFRDWR